MASYTYLPENTKEYGKDRMRFELGDTQVEDGRLTCALCDEEYEAAIAGNTKTPRQWKRAKLACMESIFRRFSYEADTKEGPLSLMFGARAKLWQEEYEKLKAELKKGAASPDAIAQIGSYGNGSGFQTPYFYHGMMSTEEREGRNTG